MLERFHVPHDIAVKVNHEEIFSVVEDIFIKMGMSKVDAKQSADVLIYADVRGIESHGVSNMLRRYVESFSEGGINPTPTPKVIRGKGAVATLDSDAGHGLVVGPYAMNMAIEKAKDYGIGSVTVINGRHFGACAYHAEMALNHNMIGIAMTTGGLMVAPVNGAEARVGLNPIGVAVPPKNQPPFIFDASMSSVAGNKISLAQRLGVKVMPGWIAKEDGTPIMEETEVPEKYLMLPAGGTREIGSHKGFSLAMLVEILAGVLGGSGAGLNRRSQAAHHFIAYDIDAFTDVDQFKLDMDDYMKSIKETKPSPGNDRVVYAGLPEFEEKLDRESNGIPYHPEVLEWFKGICAELGIDWKLS